MDRMREREERESSDRRRRPPKVLMGVFPNATWESEGIELCLPDVVFEFATVRNRPYDVYMALALGEAFASDFSWMCHMSICAAIPL